MLYKAIASVTFPCKGCERRSAVPNCHGYCEEYINAQEQQAVFREKLEEEKLKQTYKTYRRNKYGVKKNKY